MGNKTKTEFVIFNKLESQYLFFWAWAFSPLSSSPGFLKDI